MEDTENYKLVKLEKEVNATDVGITVAEYLLSPAIPISEQEKFKEFSILYCNIMALGNIERHERFAMICAFEEIAILLEWGAYERAHQLMAMELMMMQSSRSIGAMGMMYALRGVERKELVGDIVENIKKKKSLTGRVVSAIKPKKQ